MTDGPALGRYILERRIASGGMADVYLATQTGSYGFSKRVALKVLKNEISRDDEHVKMFIREALVAAEFRHPNLAQVYEVGEHDGKLFIAMELVPGVSVSSMLHSLGERGKAMPMNAAVRIAIDALDGLAHAHEAAGQDGRPLGLVHRDVSPQNIMVAVDGSVKVVDFGIARAELAFGRTMAPKIKGKFSYMPPEQWEPNSAMDSRADIFALGVVLYEMTTGGARLFRGDSPKDVYKAVVIDPIPDPRARVAAYPAGLAKIVMRALERGPGARWPSARAMRTALVDFAQGENWSLTSRAVADVVRTAIGRGDIESQWEPVVGDGSRPAAQNPEGNTLVDVPTAVERPSRMANMVARDERAGAARERSVGPVLGALAGVLALAVGVIGGFALGRRAGRMEQDRDRGRAAALTTAPGAILRVRGPGILFDGQTGRVLRERWRAAHPELELAASASGASESIGALSGGSADIAVTTRRPTESESTTARSRGAEIASEAASARVGDAAALLVVPSASSLRELTLDRAREIFRGGASSDGGLALHAIARAPVDELLALASETLLAGAAPGAGTTAVDRGEDALARAAADPSAIALLAASEYGPHPRADVRALTVRDGAGSTDASALRYPVWALTRGPATGGARAFVDWLRAPEQRDVRAMASLVDSAQ